MTRLTAGRGRAHSLRQTVLHRVFGDLLVFETDEHVSAICRAFSDGGGALPADLRLLSLCGWAVNVPSAGASCKYRTVPPPDIQFAGRLSSTLQPC